MICTNFLRHKKAQRPEKMLLHPQQPDHMGVSLSFVTGDRLSVHI